MRLPPLVLLSLLLGGCIDNRATVIHEPSSDLGYAWIGPTETVGAQAAPTTERQGHKPQELVADAWRKALRRPTWVEWLSYDRVQSRTWPTIVPVSSWGRRRWARLGDVGSPAAAPEREDLERGMVVAQSPIPWWQCFPFDIGASVVPVDITSYDREVVAYRAVPPTTAEALRQQAEAAGYLAPRSPATTPKSP